MSDDPSSHHNATYLMARDTSASMRLNYQHWILEDRQGWLLHPTIEKDIEGRKDLKVAEIGCRNGIWSIELAEKLPHAHITALDTSSAQFPPEAVSPKNITWDNHDLGDDIPEQYLGQYDVVYNRFVVQSSPKLSVALVVDRAKKLLKPGGWFQWDEFVPPVGGLVDPATLKPVEGAPHAVYAVPNEIHHTWKRIEQVPNLDKIFAEHGFQKTELVRPGFNRTYLKAGSDNNVVGALEWFRTVEPTLQDKELKDKLEAATLQMQEDAHSGKMFGLFYIVAVGQKPSS